VTAGMLDALKQGRESHRRRAWGDAFESLSRADRAAPLGAADLELLATAAYLVGRDADRDEVLARAHHEWLRLGGAERAARCAFWLAYGLLNRGELARGGGWLTRARRLLDDRQLDCVEQGYLLLPLAIQRLVEGDAAGAYTTFGQVAKIGDRFGDRDLATLAGAGRGQALLRLVSLVVGPLIMAVGDLLHPKESSDLGRQAAIIVGRASRWYLAHLLLFLGLVVFVPGLLTLADLAAARRPRVGYAARLLRGGRRLSCVQI
jgi:hypothetical protein